MEKKKHRKAKKILLIFTCVIVVLAVGVFALLKMTFLKSFPKLKGEPEIGKWYEVAVEGTQSSDGSEWHGIFKKGTENKVVVYFFGGGVSITGSGKIVLAGKPVIKASEDAGSVDDLLVLDAKKLTITVMTQTLYGEKIREANNLYNEGRYIESVNYWEEVLLMNPNFTRAYVGMGKACLAMDDEQSIEMFNVGKYEQAMDFFMLGKDQEGYAEAKAGLRDEIVRTNFGLVAAIVILAMISILGYDQIKAMFRKIAWKISTRKGD